MYGGPRGPLGSDRRAQSSRLFPEAQGLFVTQVEAEQLSRATRTGRDLFKERAWIALPQVVSRGSSVVVFALVAQKTDSDQLGAFALASAISSAPVALALALVGKPLAAFGPSRAAGEEARSAQSAAVLASLLVGLGLLAGALAMDGLVQLALLGGAIGVPAIMMVEGTFWRDVFTRGSRQAGGLLSAAYFVQALGVAAVAHSLESRAVVLSPFVTLLAVGVIVTLARRELSLQGAWIWFRDRRPSWLPYVLGVAASVILIQAIPVVITATAGFHSASVYRAGELAFGATNLLIGIATQTLLARGATKPRGTYLRFSVVVGLVALLNGLVIALLPPEVLGLLVGPAEPLLGEVLPVITIQRCALVLSSIGGVLLVPLISARRYGLLDVVAAAASLAGLVVGGVLDGLGGALGGIAAAEVLLAVLYFRLLRRET